MSTIRETVHDSLRSSGRQQYLSYADGVIRALEQREQQITATLRQAAQQRGLNGSEIDNLFVQVGLTQRPQPMATTPNTPGDEQAILDEVRALRQEVAALRNAAQRHGVTV